MLDLIQWRARKAPEAQALFFNGRWYSYRDLEGRANRLANRLLSLGVKRGDRIAVIARNHPVHFDLLLAAPKIGVVFAPFNPHVGEAEMAEMAAMVKPAMVFADSRYHAAAAATGAPWARLSDYHEWLAVGSLDAPPPPLLSVDEAHTQFFTPRGVAVLPYRQVLLNARHSADVWDLSPRDGTVHCLPCFGPELLLLCLPILYRGGRVVLMSGFNADEYLSHLALHRVTVAALSPGMLRQLTNFRHFEEADLTSLDWLASVGAAMPLTIRRSLHQRGLKLRLLTPLAEAGPNLFDASASDDETRPERLGQPLPELSLKVCSSTGEELPQGEPGELRVAGPMVFSGYLDATSTAATVLHEGWLATGRAVVKDQDGQYLHRGDIGDAFVSEGMRIFPVEIEAALLQCEGVVDCAVTGIDESGQGLAILAAIVLSEGIKSDDDALRQALAHGLPPGKRPTYFLRLRVLPRDGWGVVRRDELVQACVQARAVTNQDAD